MHSSSPGDSYKAFVVDNNRQVPELRCRLLEVHHEPSKAKVIHIEADDQENLFCLSFQTLPYSSNGVAHLLEHLVLCGSERFPVRDPFFSMTRRSLNSYMNALTGTDFTCYPAASQLEKDFYNLLDVYLDAVFHPLLSPVSFLQEAHRLEHSDKNDPSSALAINGVVYNEMKGALAQPMRRLMRGMCAKLFPHTPYGHDSGGDPREIASVTLEELVDFHSKYYHPSRCVYFFYGNFPLAKHLDFLEDRILKGVVPLPQHPPVPRQQRLQSPVAAQLQYPIAGAASAEDRTYIAFGWLTADIENQLECLALAVLDIIFFDTDASYLTRHLLQTGRCRQVTSSCDTEMAQLPFIFVASGCNPEDADVVQTAVNSALKSLVSLGLPKSSVESALHQLELAKSEIGDDGGPFGLSLYSRTALLAHHGIDPIVGLEIHQLFRALREAVASKPTFFQELIQRYLLDNPHFVRIVMTPSRTIEAEEQRQEEQLIMDLQGRLTKGQGAGIVPSQTAKLDFLQEAEEDLACLPTIHLSDAAPLATHLALESVATRSVDFFSHETCTNGLVYLDVVLPIPHIPQKDLWLVRLFAHLLPQLGCGNKGYQESLDFLQAYTGGASTSLSLNQHIFDSDAIRPSWHLRAKALARNAEPLCSILKNLSQEPRLDERERIQEVLEKLYTDLEGTVNRRALDYALCRSSATLSKPFAISEEWYGLSYYQKIRQLVKNYAKEEASFLRALEGMRQLLLGNAGIQVVACADSATLDRLKRKGLFGLAEGPQRPFCPWSFDLPPRGERHNQGFIISSQVSCSAITVPTAPYASPDAPCLSVLAQLMNDTFLHHQLREQGGAYGGGASCNPVGASFSFYAHKDPNVFTTLKAFEAAVSHIQEGNFTEQELEEAKLGLLQDLDAPIPPGSRAEVAYSRWRQGKTDQYRQRFRDIVISSAREDIVRLIPTYFPPGWSRGGFVTFAGKELLNKERQFFEKADQQLHLHHCI